MKRYASTSVLVFMLFIFLFVGYGGEETMASPGEAAEYERLLDMNYWAEWFDPDVYTEGLGDEFIPLVDAFIDALGIYDWEQTKLQAAVSGDSVRLESVFEFTGGEDDDSLSALALKWQPGWSEMPALFQRDDLLALVAVGNPTGVYDVKMEWLLKSDSFQNIIESIPYPDEMAPLMLMWGTSKMTAKGYWYTAQEEYYRLIGDAFVFALYTNDDFIGWEESWSADSFLEGSPVRFIIAVELGEPGLTEALNEAIQGYIDTFTAIIEPYEYHPPGEYEEDEEESPFEIRTSKMLGREIFYLDFDGAFQLAWMEHEGALFVSDLDTLEGIDKYFRELRPIDDVPDRFNEYLYADVDKLLDTFYRPFEDGVIEEYEWWKEYYEGPPLGIAEDIIGTLGRANLGEVEITELYSAKGVETSMEISKSLADLMLKGQEMLEAIFADGLTLFETFPSPFSGSNPARHPDLPEIIPGEPPAHPREPG
jgi:hypothetical protein